ncbi:class II aldolase/adducin family protein [Pseudonocardia asaccharolytica]|uniref:Fuculose phosphate aldolase n=1 Tax=Pseudonocardia asaccharolytica DSM 44247 = NBRC 16224 TaxID=1123024 RepID=A0A511D6F2_9PSEU|nr:class II aldolase/adducin family protein [Pseudonocardia asaccharolytica]GEL20370.1 fuculose phosphate aldolase [Pseudonocardia asaccharolytica DSM 44247 = NBRC 16224]
MLLHDERVQLVEYCRRMQADELTVGTSGNLSVRSGNHIAITPSGVPYAELTPESICVLDLAGNRVEDGLEPSTEVPMHTQVYAQTDAVAVVHTHPLYACTLSALIDELPPVHYMIALLGGPVRVAPYATFGSPELARNSVRAMAGRFGVILQNHGATTYGDSLAKAYTRSVYLEWVCRMYYQARLLGEPNLLPAEEIERVAAKLDSYGQSAAARRRG